jgi:hypothetical protein
MFVLAGVYAQPVDAADKRATLRSKSGNRKETVPVLSEDRLCLIIANALCDWHGLYKLDDKRFAFGPPGDLRWAPRYPRPHGPLLPGTAVIIEPPTRPGESKLSYEVPVRDEGFIDLPLLMRAEAVEKLPSVITGRSQKKHWWFHFPDYVEFENAAEHHVALNENSYWRMIIEIYAKATDETLAALASCRTAQTTTLSLAASMMYWVVRLKAFLDNVAALDHCGGDPLPNFDKELLPVQEAVKVMEAVIAARHDIQRHFAILRKLAASTPLGKHLPMTNAAAIGIDCDEFVDPYFAQTVLPWITAIMLLANEIVQRLDGRRINAISLAGALTSLKKLPGVTPKQVAFPKWADWLGDNASVPRAVNACAGILSHLVDALRVKTRLTIDDVPAFYADIFHRYYPLPKIVRPSLKDVPGSGGGPEKPRPNAARPATL